MYRIPCDCRALLRRWRVSLLTAFARGEFLCRGTGAAQSGAALLSGLPESAESGLGAGAGARSRKRGGRSQTVDQPEESARRVGGDRCGVAACRRTGASGSAACVQPDRRQSAGGDRHDGICVALPHRSGVCHDRRAQRGKLAGVFRHVEILFSECVLGNRREQSRQGNGGRTSAELSAGTSALRFRRAGQSFHSSDMENHGELSVTCRP